MSQNSLLSGTYEAPDGAITVLSQTLEEDVEFQGDYI